jgi:hypothetical protein
VLRLLIVRCACISVALIVGFPCFGADGPRFETYVSGEYSGRAAGVATATVWSPFGSIEEPGLRLKLSGDASIHGDGPESVFSKASEFSALADVMVGYQAHWDRISMKVYGGVAVTQALYLVSLNPHLESPGRDYSAAVAVESFWRANDRIWLGANVSWLQFANTITLYERVAYEFVRADDDRLAISTGLELGTVLQDVDNAGKRLDLGKNIVKEGAMLSIRYWSHELTISGGGEKASDEGVWRPYATLSYGKKF